jgi:phage gpG-like protein
MSNNIPDFHAIARQLIADAQTIAEVEMINFIVGNFEKQGFTDTSFTPWQQRKNNDDAGRAILVKSAALRDSISITEANDKRIVATATAKYAAIHNEGGVVNIPVTPKMKKWFWYMYKRTRNEKYKLMALTKKSHFTFTMPKRQFMGDSQAFMKIIEDKFFNMIAERFKAI